MGKFMLSKDNNMEEYLKMERVMTDKKWVIRRGGRSGSGRALNANK